MKRNKRTKLKKKEFIEMKGIKTISLEKYQHTSGKRLLPYSLDNSPAELNRYCTSLYKRKSHRMTPTKRVSNGSDLQLY